MCTRKVPKYCIGLHVLVVNVGILLTAKLKKAIFYKKSHHQGHQKERIKRHH